MQNAHRPAVGRTAAVADPALHSGSDVAQQIVAADGVLALVAENQLVDNKLGVGRAAAVKEVAERRLRIGFDRGGQPLQ
jgi:hypothetical protein